MSAPTNRRQIGTNTNREGQINKAIELIGELREINPEWVEEQRAEMNSRWTQGTCDFNYVSAQITAMIDAKRASRTVATKRDVPVVSSGRYAIGAEGDAKCYRVVNKDGSYHVFSYHSDNQKQMVNWTAIVNVLRAIARDGEEAAGVRFGRVMKKCRTCGHAIHDESNPYYSQGYGPDCGKKV